MSTSIEDLSTQTASIGQNPANLEKAFLLFSKETKRLQKSYQTLKEQFKDVNSELQEKVEELDTVSHYLHNILQNIKQGLLFISLDGTISTINLAVEEILGLQKSDLLFSNFWDKFEDTAFGFSVQNALYTHSAPERLEIQLQSGKSIEVTASFVKQDAGEQSGMLLLLRDMTDLRQLQKIAERNDRMKELGEMAASVAHEIRNPLGGIRGYASLLSRDLADDPKKKEMCAFIVQGAERLDYLVREVLQYTRPIQPQLQPTCLKSLITSTQDLLRPDPLFEKGVTFSNDFSSSPTLSLDPSLMKGVFMNLFVNAAQAMHGKGNIHIIVRASDNNTLLEVIDEGEGIAPEHLEKIFSPFFTTKDAGTGFGLSEVYKVILAHGGQIDVSSTQNVGTTFQIKFRVN